MARVHIYESWGVTLANGNTVHFQDQLSALKYWGEAEGRTTLEKGPNTEWPCMVEKRVFCGHCAACSYTVERV